MTGMQQEWISNVDQEDKEHFYEECTEDPDICFVCEDSTPWKGRCSWCLNNMCPKHFECHKECCSTAENDGDDESEDMAEDLNEDEYEQEEEAAVEVPVPIDTSEAEDGLDPGPPPLTSDSSDGDKGNLQKKYKAIPKTVHLTGTPQR